MLNKDQEAVLKQVISWYKSSERFLIISGAGGTGKSFLINQIIKELKVEPLILCPTNEALKQLRDKVDGDYIFKTIHSALGMAPTDGEDEIEFEQIKLPKLWDEVEFVILDECSMVSEDILKILQDVGKKTLFVGHASQLPPVKKKKSIFDKCISPVFDQGYRILTLTIPMRNTGTLWDFNNHLEKMIYTKDINVPTTFDVKRVDLGEYVKSAVGIKEIFEGRTKFVLWSNNEVDRYNHRIRLNIYGEAAKHNKYLIGDKIIITKPLLVVESLDHMNDSILKEVNKVDCQILYTNSKAEVISCIIVDISLNKALGFQAYKITCKTEVGVIVVFEPLLETDRVRIGDYYKHIAWGKHGKEKQNAFIFKNFVLSCLAEIKHAYAQTSHRLQGSSLEHVIVIDSDIQKNMNIVERKKCRYVACSRAISKLWFFRGIL